MASVLSSFLVGIGWDTQDFDKGTKNIERSLGGVKSTALQVGAALFGAFGAKALTLDFAKQTDQLSQFSSAMGVAATDVQALGNTIATAGGDFDNAAAMIQKLTDAKDALLVKGEAGFLTDAAYSGIDPSLIKDASDGYEALMNIIGEYQNLSSEQQRTLAQTLGLSPAEIALFKQGRESVQASVEQMRKIRPVTEEATEASRKFRGELSLLGVQIGGVADQISTPLVGALGDATEAANKFIDANRPLIDKIVGEGVEFATDNFTALAVAIGGLTAGSSLAMLGALAKHVPIIGAGLGTIATNMGRLGTVAGLAGVSSLVASAADSALSANVSGYDDFDAKLTRGIYDLTGLDLSRGNVNEGTERRSLNPWSDVSDPYIEASRDASRERSDWWGRVTSPSKDNDTARIGDYSGYGALVGALQTEAPSFEVPSFEAPSFEAPSFEVPDYSPRAPIYNQQAVQPTINVVVPESQTTSRDITSRTQPFPPVQVTLQLDGRVLDERIIDVNERTASSVVEDLQTTTSR